jgi:hypothetical protein
LQCEIAGDFPLPRTVPKIVWRGGLDINPVDLTDDDDVHWLLSCVWPEHGQRRKRLAAAIEYATGCELNVRRGDLVKDVSGLLRDVPLDARLVVLQSAVFPYVPEEDRVEFANLLRQHSRGRDIVWITNEGFTAVPEITQLAPETDRNRFLIGRSWFKNEERTDELLALAHPHGAELEWLY